ncbi:hypothetical protein HPB49_014722 [Dermacentor silvarum]|uniref:Uncharacterized protein n=1 Tax=Dermacentor silvarum TaxID=543639 RepID=A0ACB8CFQ1_DERSI|nr:hypothetical protein HPB49_014722 [Dermacentor silvarum]
MPGEWVHQDAWSSPWPEKRFLPRPALVVSPEKYTHSGRNPRPVSTAGGLGTAQTYARCPALKHQYAEDAENIHQRH